MKSLAVLAVTAFLVSCNCGSDSLRDAGSDGGKELMGQTGGGAAGGGSSVGGGDAGPVDAGAPDSGSSDAGPPDAGAADAGPQDSGFIDSGVSDSGTADSGVVDAGPLAAYSILVSQSPGGPLNSNPASWGGLLQYVLPTDGGGLVPLPGVDAGLLHDPVSLLFRADLNELFVSNRHGNNSADGTAGSISRFTYHRATRTFTPNGAILGNGLSGVHQIAFNPVDGELFACNVSAGISRFLLVDGGVVANGTIANGNTRGVYVSQNGRRLYVTDATATVRQFDLDAGTELPGFSVPSPSAQLHEIHSLNGTVSMGGLFDDRVSMFSEAADGTLTYTGFLTSSGPVSAVVDATGQTLYVSGHKVTDVIERFSLDAGQWVHEATYPTGYSLGGIVLLP